MPFPADDFSILKPARQHRRGWNRAFTLVELLVVIGIIALLIGILLPSLAVARQQASKASCSAKLHAMMQAAQVHVADHQGYYPLAGELPGCTPNLLNDDGLKNYFYDEYDPAGINQCLAPITMALAAEMGYGNLLNISGEKMGPPETDPKGFIRNFLCPSQAVSVDEIQNLYTQQGTPPPLLYAGGASNGISVVYTETQSYIFNEAVVGYDDSLSRLRGQQSKVRQPARTMFAADGLVGQAFPFRNTGSNLTWTDGQGFMTVYNKVNDPPITLADAYQDNNLAGDSQCFDLHRHQNRMNVAFCDGHVETKNITVSDLSTVYILAP